MKRRVLPLCVALVALALTACGGPDDGAEDDLRAAINRTERLARTFTYTEDADGSTNEVVGLIEDDFRSKVRLSIDDEPAFDQVQSDDVLALRFVDTDRLDDMVDPAIDVSEEEIDPVEALGTRRWVLDPAGAPPLVADDVDSDRQLGDDPVLDALNVFSYIRAAIGGAAGVWKFNPDSLDYKPSEDPFPHPEDDVIRYDLVRPNLPRASIVAGNQPPLPGTIHLRKMSVYVEDGRVIRVLEQVDPDERLDDIIDSAVNYLRDANASDEAIARVRALEDAPPAEATQAVIAGVNLFLEQQGDDPIRLRTMTLEFDQLGGLVEVEVPTDYVAASLDVLRYRGRDVVIEDEDETEDEDEAADEPAPSTSTTTAGGA